MMRLVAVLLLATLCAAQEGDIIPPAYDEVPVPYDQPPVSYDPQPVYDQPPVPYAPTYETDPTYDSSYGAQDCHKVNSTFIVISLRHHHRHHHHHYHRCRKCRYSD